MSCTTSKTVTSLVAEEADTSEGLTVMLDNCDRIAEGTAYDYSVAKCLAIIRKVIDELEFDFGDEDFSGDYAVERHQDEIIFFGNARVEIGNGYQAVMHWEALEHHGQRMIDVKVLRDGRVESAKATRFDPFELDAVGAIVKWIQTVAQAVGVIND